MEFDTSNLLYIAFAILYFVFTARKKGQKKNAGDPSSSPERSGDTVGPVPTNQQPTFEDLLEQFTGQRKVKEAAKPVVVEESTSSVIEEIKSNQTRKSIYSEANKLYGAKKRTETSSIIFHEPEEELAEGTDYAALISDTDGARKAFVMSEIFNRKY
ncbi:hypothetical protein [Roseivirga echinicomitans]|uniref:Uncharacterized protein n=1 Tax=Roseivirga echinicomitans TaxID=296218 RepID=A0A150X9P1_9BACT|nr:hypothetical protein [Roseivirga echinicomitans]KYG75455.1 hypothetical protein AWN68_07875 [Roseivirga echinicomitans]